VAPAPEARWVSTALSEMLATELAMSDALRLVPGEDVARARRDLGVGATDELAPAALRRFGDSLGAELVVRGAYLAAADGLRVDLRVARAGDGEILAS